MRKFLGGIDGQAQRAQNFGDGTAATDLVTKQQLDQAGSNLDWKDYVRVATTVAGTLASSFANGSTVDTIVLATGDRILIKDQASGQENGIYVVNASGAPTRASDADSAAEIKGSVVNVSEGATNGDKTFQLTTDTITLNTTPLVWGPFNAGAAYTASLGVVKVGNDFRAQPDPTSDTIEAVAGGLRVKAGKVPIKYAQDVGVMTGGTPLTITHGLGTLDVVVQVVIKGTGEVVDLDVIVASTTTITLTSAAAQSAAFLRVTVIG